MTTTTIILLIALAWIVFTMPLAVLIGRMMRNADRQAEAQPRADIEAALRRILDDDDDD